jgi:MFS transporter, DHA1 family, inner membrane transport protein
MSAGNSLSRDEKLLLLILGCIQFTHIMDFMVMMPLGEIFMNYFRITPREFSILVASYTFSAAICVFIGAFFIDKVDRKSALLVCYTGFVAGTMACAAAPSFYFLLGARMVTGAFGGILSALVLSVIGDVFPFERRGKPMGVLMAAFSVASVIGVPFGYYLAIKFNWHAPFLFLSLFGTALVYFIFLKIPTLTGHITDGPRPSPFSIIADIVYDNNKLRALFFMMLLMIGQFTIIPFIAPFMERNVGFAQEHITYIYLIGGAFTIFTAPWVGRLSDKHGKPKVFTWFALAAIVPIIAITNLPDVPVYVALIATTAFFIVASGRIIPAMTMITSVVSPQQRGSFMSINAAIQQFSAGLAAFAAGLIVVESHPGGPLENYTFAGLLAVAATVASIYVGRKLKRAEDPIMTNTVEDKAREAVQKVPVKVG